MAVRRLTQTNTEKLGAAVVFLYLLLLAEKMKVLGGVIYSKFLL